MEGFRHSPAHATTHDVAARYRRSLLNALGLAGVSTPATPAPHPSIAWARSGAMQLTGSADHPPLLAPSCIASCSDAVLQSFAAVTRCGSLGEMRGSELLAERAAIAGHERQGRISVGGTCRLFRCGEEWLAVNLAREDDAALVPAWLEIEPSEDVWESVERGLAHRGADAVDATMKRGHDLGLPLARLNEAAARSHWTRIAQRGEDRIPVNGEAPLVIDLSSLWAGPLATHLLERAGARVVKVESSTRPDGARRGPSAFYDLLNAGKESVVLDFGSREDLGLLKRLLERADIVVEASRPRALEQLGFDAAGLVRERAGLTWVSITGYGREGRNGERVAFGDDAAIAGGLVAYQGDEQQPVFCGDAIADPLTGMHAALAAYGSWRLGGGRLLDIALAGVASHVASFADSPGDATVLPHLEGTAVSVGAEEQLVTSPRPRTAHGPAAALGEHTRAVIEELC